jgi:hypothetical protein
VPCVSLLQICGDPALDVGDFREGVPGLLFACVELGKADAEAEFVDVCVGDDVVVRDREGRVD